MFEQTAVFERGIGEATDVVEKELFRIRRGREESEAWALRPEATAGIVRAYVQHGMQTWPQPVKLTVVGPMFRYDRPQAGRYRQFWQWDVEAIGDPGPAVDAEIVELGYRFYWEAGCPGVQVLLNSIGDPVCRPAYLDKLRAYFALATDEPARARAEQAQDEPAAFARLQGPGMAASFSRHRRCPNAYATACSDHFDAVKAHLEAVGVPYRVSRRSSEAWITTPARRSSTTAAVPKASSRRSAAAADTTAWSNCSAAGPRRGSGLRWVWTASCWRSKKSATEGTHEAPPRPSWRALIRPTAVARLRVASLLRAEGLSVRAELAPRKLGRQLETASQGTRPLRGDHRRRTDRGERPAEGPGGGHATPGAARGPGEGTCASGEKSPSRLTSLRLSLERIASRPGHN